jgi:tyrosinase
MKFISMLAAVGAVAALPASKPQAECKNPEKRIEWRQMDPQDQKSYLDAVLCLKTKPSKIGLNSTLYDDFPNVHFKLNNYSLSGPSTSFSSLQIC